MRMISAHRQSSGKFDASGCKALFSDDVVRENGTDFNTLNCKDPIQRDSGI